MYNASTLSVGTETLFYLGSLIVDIGVIWVAFVAFRRSVSRDNKNDWSSKADVTVVTKLEKDIDMKIEHLEKDNIRSHGEIRAEITLSEQRTKDDSRRHIDQFQDFMITQFKELKEDIRSLKKTG